MATYYVNNINGIYRARVDVGGAQLPGTLLPHSNIVFCPQWAISASFSQLCLFFKITTKIMPFPDPGVEGIYPSQYLTPSWPQRR